MLIIQTEDGGEGDLNHIIFVTMMMEMMLWTIITGLTVSKKMILSSISGNESDGDDKEDGIDYD